MAIITLSLEYSYLANNMFNGITNFNELNTYSNLTFKLNNQFKSKLLWQQYNTSIPSLKYLFLVNNTLLYVFLGYNQFNDT